MTAKVPNGNTTQVAAYLKTLNMVWATGGQTAVPPDSKFNTGWVVELPPYEFDNYLLRQITTFIAHNNKFGIPEWDSVTVYVKDQSYVKGSDGYIYVAKEHNTNKNPTLSTGDWIRAFEPYGGVNSITDEFRNFRQNIYPKLLDIDVEQSRNRLDVYSRGESDARFARLDGDGSRVFSVASPTSPLNAVNLLTLDARLAATLRLASGQDIQGETPASANLALSAAAAAQFYLKKDKLLSEFDTPAKKESARSNLGLGSAATKNDDFFFKISNIFAELDTSVKKSTARSNLGLGSASTLNETGVYKTANMLSELDTNSKKENARTNLGLGSAATKNVSSGAGGVAASDDTRLINAVQKNYIVEALAGLVMGGALSNPNGKTGIGLGTPSTVSKTSTNAVTAESHSHAFDMDSFITGEVKQNGWIKFPNGLMIQWGTFVESSGKNDWKSWPTPFEEDCYVFIPCINLEPKDSANGGGFAIAKSRTGFVFTAGDIYGSKTQAFVIAIGK